MPKNPKKNKKQPLSPKSTDSGGKIELEADAWERFEKGVEAIGKARKPTKPAKKDDA